MNKALTANICELARRGGQQMELTRQAVKEIRLLDWIVDTTGHAYVSCHISLAAARYARRSVDEQHDTLDGCTVVWRDHEDTGSGV